MIRRVAFALLMLVLLRADMFQDGSNATPAAVTNISQGNLVASGSALWMPKADAVLGIRTATPTMPIQVCDNWSGSATQLPIMSINCTQTTSANAHGYRNFQKFIGTGTSSSFNGYDDWPTASTTGTDPTTHYAGFQSRAVIDSDFPIVKMFQAIPTFTAGTNTTNYYSYFSQPNIQFGTATNAYGYYAAQMSSIANPAWATNRYAFYAVSDPSFFGGSVDIGTGSYAGGPTPTLSIKNTNDYRLLNVGTAVGGGGVYVSGLAPTGMATGRPTVDNAQILLDRHTDLYGGGIEYINAGNGAGYGHKIVNPSVASGAIGTNRPYDLIFYGRQNAADWSENLRISPNGTGVGVVNNGIMGANLSVGTSVGSFRVYNSAPNTTDLEWFQASWTGGIAHVGTYRTGIGVARAMNLETNGTAAITIDINQQVALPAIGSTGTAVASLCIDAAGKIFKKTTTGPCL